MEAVGCLKWKIVGVSALADTNWTPDAVQKDLVNWRTCWYAN